MSDFDDSKIKTSLESNKSLLRIIIEFLIKLTLIIFLYVSFFLLIVSSEKVHIFWAYFCGPIPLFLFIYIMDYLYKLNDYKLNEVVYFFPFPLDLIFIILYKYIINNKQNNLGDKDKYFALSKYPNLSIVRIFANKLETQKLYSAYLLLIVTAAYSILGLVWKQFEINIYFILGGLIYASLLYLNTLLVNFRIKKGFYGGNEFEAREIINFIEENSENIDFSDGDSPKQLFNEEDLKEIEEEIRIELNSLPQPNI